MINAIHEAYVNCQYRFWCTCISSKYSFWQGSCQLGEKHCVTF